MMLLAQWLAQNLHCHQINRDIEMCKIAEERAKHWPAPHTSKQPTFDTKVDSKEVEHRLMEGTSERCKIKGAAMSLSSASL